MADDLYFLTKEDRDLLNEILPIARALKRARGMKVSPSGISVRPQHSPATPILSLPDPPIYVNIDSYTQANGATWHELTPPAAGVTPSIKSGGHTNETRGAAFEISNAPGVPAASGTNGTKALLFQIKDANGNPVNVFAYPGAGFWAKVDSSSQDGTNKRWAYTFTEVEKTSAGYGGWAVKSGGRTGTAYNSIEDQNGATGTWGNGVASTNLTGTITIKAAPNSTRIWLVPVALTTGAIEYWFSYENGVDGAC